MSLPFVAIVGRPNVGKSSLLNRLAATRISIVEPTPGVTRDRISHIIEHRGRWLELVDTGGHGIEDSQGLTEHVEHQIAVALDRADLILFVVDVREGITPLDRKVAELLRPLGKPIQLVANKADLIRLETLAAEFFRFGFGEPVVVSATEGVGRETLLDAIVDRLGEKAAREAPPEPVMKMAIVGKRNAGKSTLVNALAGGDRVIVSEVPGTTRDSVDVRFQRDGQTFVVIDTAGVKKTGQIKDSIEFYSYARAQRAVRRADVCVLLIDAAEKVGLLEKQLARFVGEEFKPCIICINKWDIVGDKATTDDYAEYVGKVLPWLDHAPMSFISAKEEQHLGDLVDLALELHKQAGVRVTTAELNRTVEMALSEKTPSPKRRLKLPRVYYTTQIDVRPPTLVMFVNDPALFDENYRRFLVNRFRQVLPFGEVPIRLEVRSRREGGRKRPVDRSAEGAARADGATESPVPAAPAADGRGGEFDEEYEEFEAFDDSDEFLGADDVEGIDESDGVDEEADGADEAENTADEPAPPVPAKPKSASPAAKRTQPKAQPKPPSKSKPKPQPQPKARTGKPAPARGGKPKPKARPQKPK